MRKENWKYACLYKCIWYALLSGVAVSGLQSCHSAHEARNFPSTMAVNSVTVPHLQNSSPTGKLCKPPGLAPHSGCSLQGQLCVPDATQRANRVGYSHFMWCPVYVICGNGSVCCRTSWYISDSACHALVSWIPQQETWNSLGWKKIPVLKRTTQAAQKSQKTKQWKNLGA